MLHVLMYMRFVRGFIFKEGSSNTQMNWELFCVSRKAARSRECYVALACWDRI